ncbi:MAG TPA: EscN/YscN/HrcN family type III secretion system ATPase, partial [Fimbriimonadaceae bacterium]|nr:EscN/YscN/HrcN family type III secretion system ATPase [Fimbriimonadaceae bacterium]
MTPAITLPRLRKALSETPAYTIYGKVVQVVGLVIESSGPAGRIGDLCTVETRAQGQEVKTKLAAEIVGFRGDRVLLMPLGDLDGIEPGSLVQNTGKCLQVPTGLGLLGRTIDGLGRPIDNLGDLQVSGNYPILASPPNALDRKMINRPLATGVRVIDGILTLGEGQRMGIFAGSGVGKSTLLGMIARNCEADVNVIALVGERGREVKEFIENDLGPEGLARSIIVCATSEQPALVRIKASLTATAIAEYFRDQGKSVLLMMDSVTRFA